MMQPRLGGQPDGESLVGVSRVSRVALGATLHRRSVAREIRLLAWMRLGESRDAHAVVVNAHDAAVGHNVGLEELRRRHLRDEADVGHGRAVAMAEVPAGFFSVSSCSIACRPAPSQCWIQRVRSTSSIFSTSVR